MKLLVVLFVLAFAAVLAFDNSTSSLASSGDVHSRQKRYVIFPKGASLQLVYCNTYLFKPVVDIFRFGTTAGLAWMLPDDPSFFNDKKQHKIFRRSVFQKLEALIQAKGNNGRQCILRALCESGQRTPSKKSFMREIMHRVFAVDGEEEDWESYEDRLYRRAHRSVNQDCEKLYPECGFSVFDYI